MTVEDANSKRFRNLLKTNKGIVVFRFWAKWCAPCRTMTRIYQQVSNEMAGKAQFFDVNTEKQYELADRCAIRAIPAVLIYRNGKMVKKIDGVVSAPDLKKMISHYL